MKCHASKVVDKVKTRKREEAGKGSEVKGTHVDPCRIEGTSGTDR